MGVDAVSNVSVGMAKNFSFSIFISIGVIKQCSKCMPGVVWSMALAIDTVHDFIPDG